MFAPSELARIVRSMLAPLSRLNENSALPLTVTKSGPEPTTERATVNVAVGSVGAVKVTSADDRGAVGTAPPKDTVIAEGKGPPEQVTSPGPIPGRAISAV